jgi:hypothetical protein
MPIGIVEIHSSAAIVLVDFVEAAFGRIGPIANALFGDALKHLVEFIFAD